MKLRRPVVAMAEERKEEGQGRLGTEGWPATPLLLVGVRGARHALAAELLARSLRNPCL